MQRSRVNWRPDARADLQSILNYISQNNPVAALALIDMIEARANSLLNLPLAHRAGRLPGTREMVVHPNYIVVYRATEAAITILRILHTARNWP